MEPIFYDYDSEPSRKAYNREYEDGVAGLGYRVPPLPLAMDQPEEISTGTSASSQETEVTRPPDIYPDPDHIYATFLNKSTMKRNRFPGEENVIKVCEYSSGPDKSVIFTRHFNPQILGNPSERVPKHGSTTTVRSTA